MNVFAGVSPNFGSIELDLFDYIPIVVKKDISIFEHLHFVMPCMALLRSTGLELPNHCAIAFAECDDVLLVRSTHQDQRLGTDETG